MIECPMDIPAVLTVWHIQNTVFIVFLFRDLENIIFSIVYTILLL